MRTALIWIGRNLSFGGLVRNAGVGAGILGRISLSKVGNIASLATKNEKAKESIRATFCATGEKADLLITKSSARVGDFVNLGVQKTGTFGGIIFGGATRLAKCSEQNVLLARNVGNVAGTVAVGMLVGVGIADAALALGAAAGTAGGAATTSGLAALGGGSIAAGGGGMAAGHAVMQAITAGGVASGAATCNAEDLNSIVDSVR